MANRTLGSLRKEAMALNLRGNIVQLAGTATIGLVAGLAAVGFHQTMILLANGLVEAPSKWPGAMFALFVLTAMGAAAWVTGWLMSRFAPDAPGSGIPQVKVAYHRGTLDFSWQLVWVKFLGGALSIGTGSSLGREGPTIHIGAALASKIAKTFGEVAPARANAVCAGSAAGLAAAFGSPLAGVTLVLEEIAGGKNEENFAGRSLLAAALASTVVLTLSGDAPSLPVGPDLRLSWRALWMAPLVAVAAGLAGLAFQYLTLAIRRRCKRWSAPGAWKLAIGTMTGGAFAFLAFALTGQLGAFGLGDQDLITSLNGGLIWTVALCLLVGKLLATAFCYGAGGCGGIFAPLLFFGAMAGVLVTGLIPAQLGLTSQDKTLLALTGMTACLGAVVRAPITSVLIVMEMTRQIYALPALMIAAVISVYMNRLCFRGNFYDEALRQDGIILDRD